MSPRQVARINSTAVLARALFVTAADCRDKKFSMRQARDSCFFVRYDERLHRPERQLRPSTAGGAPYQSKQHGLSDLPRRLGYGESVSRRSAHEGAATWELAGVA